MQCVRLRVWRVELALGQKEAKAGVTLLEAEVVVVHLREGMKAFLWKKVLWRESGGAGENVARRAGILQETEVDSCLSGHGLDSAPGTLVDTSPPRRCTLGHLPILLLHRARRICWAHTTDCRSCHNNPRLLVARIGPQLEEAGTRRTGAREEARVRVEPADGVDAPAANSTPSQSVTGNSASERSPVCASPWIVNVAVAVARTACPSMLLQAPNGLPGSKMKKLRATA